MEEPIENLYFNWLCAKVNRVEVPTPSLTYVKLLRKLFNTEFVWIVSGDDNRVEDGLELRDEFVVETGLEEHSEAPFFDLGCSVLEMLIAFSRRAEFNAGETPQFWFWLMMDNLEISFANDSAYREAPVDRRLYNFIWRLYNKNGQGGLFPLQLAPEDQKQVEIWYQFCEWLEDVNWPV
jgi:hypothetical protein